MTGTNVLVNSTAFSEKDQSLMLLQFLMKLAKGILFIFLSVIPFNYTSIGHCTNALHYTAHVAIYIHV